MAIDIFETRPGDNPGRITYIEALEHIRFNRLVEEVTNDVTRSEVQEKPQSRLITLEPPVRRERALLTIAELQDSDTRELVRQYGLQVEVVPNPIALRARIFAEAHQDMRKKIHTTLTTAALRVMVALHPQL